MERNKKGQFKKGIIPHNKGKRIYLNLQKIHNRHMNNGESIIDISKRLGVSDRLIRIRLKENGYTIRKKTEPSSLIKRKISKTLKERRIEPIEKNNIAWNKGLTKKDKRVKENIVGLMNQRKYQILPLKDSSIEVKIKEFLIQLNIKYEQHKHINIRHAYQCDFFIPIQKEIPNVIVLECDGCYWHNCPICNLNQSSKTRKQKAKDNRRTKELRGKGYKVIRLWEHQIKKLNLEDFKKIITFH